MKTLTSEMKETKSRLEILEDKSSEPEDSNRNHPEWNTEKEDWAKN